jgi:putative heme iron utilization protein
MNDATLRVLGKLLHEVRVAALGTVREGEPGLAMVLFAADPHGDALYLHISHLGRHTQSLLRHPRVSLLIIEPDRPTRNPSTLPRVAIEADAEIIRRGTPAFERAQAVYLEKHPTAELTFQLGDFLLVRLVPAAARLVAGFAQAYDVSPDELALAITMPPDGAA